MTTTTKPAISRLDDAAAKNPMLAGQKAATLAELRSEGWAVPDGFIVAAEGCEQLAAGDPSSEALRSEIGLQLQRLGNGPVAVRSSGTDEDLDDASFAGQYESYLNVVGLENVCDAIVHCAASARSQRVAAYRGSASGENSIAVLVQTMVPATKAGVAFSANPVTGDREETIVEAVNGLGDALAAGETTPEEWVVRDGETDRVGGEHAVLEESLAQEVGSLADELEDRFGTPQDIEWAATGQGLYLLQTRPITALPIEPDLDLPSEGTWTKDVAHYPEPISAFGASVYLPALDEGIRAMCSEFGLMVEGLQNTSLGGEVYGKVIPVGGKEGPPPPWWLMGILTRLVPPLRERVAAARSAVRSGKLEDLPDRWENEWRDKFRVEIERHRSKDLESMSDHELCEELDEAEELLRRGQKVHFRLFIPYMVAVHSLASLSEELLGWSADRTMRLLSGLSETSSEPARKLRELATTINTNPDARAALEKAGTDVVSALEDVDADLARAAAQHRDTYGFRAVGYDPGSPILQERPEIFARSLKAATKSASPGNDPDQVRERAEAEAREMLAHVEPARAEEFEQALARAQRVYYLREENILWTDNAPNAVLRRVALEFGRRLANRGQIGRPRDISHATRDEFVAALLGDDALTETADRRRAERAWVAAHPGPPFHGPAPTPQPDLRAIPAEARQINSAFLWFMSHEYDTTPSDGEGLSGVPGSPGTYTGPVRIVRSEAEFERLDQGDVLVCQVTTPVWSVLFGTAGAVVTDGGGALSHAAIVAREHGIPCVLGTSVATSTLTDGQIVTVDGSRGEITMEGGGVDSR